jgi:hypothetical protein
MARACAAGGRLGVAAALLVFITSSGAAEQWASCPDGSAVNTDTSFGASHVAGYAGSLSPVLLQAAAFVALTRPDQRSAVFDIVTRRLSANGVRFDPDEWLALVKDAIKGIDSNAAARGWLYGFGASLAPTPVPGVFRRTENGALFARDAVELDARECVLWPIIDTLIQSPCAQTAGTALYAAARANPTAQRACVAPTTRLTMTELHMAPGGGLKVSIAKGSATPGARVRFRAWRVLADGSAAQPIWSGEATVSSEADGSLYAVVARGVNLAVDAKRPFLRVDVDPGSGSRGPVSCEQPTGWEPRHLEPDNLNGLHGPYRVTGVAEAVAGDPATCIAFQQSKSLGSWDSAEFGFAVLRHKTTGAYYTTPPVRSGTDLKVFTSDFARSLDKAFERSCENRGDYVYAGEVHTHPDPLFTADSRYWTPADFSRAISLLQHGNIDLMDENNKQPVKDLVGVDIAYERSILINTKDREVYWFEPNNNDDLSAKMTGPAPCKLGPGMLSKEQWLWCSYIQRSARFAVTCVK